MNFILPGSGVKELLVTCEKLLLIFPPAGIEEQDIRQHLLIRGTFWELKWMLHLFKVSPESTCVRGWVCSRGRAHTACMHVCVCHPTYMAAHVLTCTLSNGRCGGWMAKFGASAHCRAKLVLAFLPFSWKHKFKVKQLLRNEIVCESHMFDHSSSP